MMHPDTLRLIADRAVNEAIKKHALAAFPQESCGVITPDGYHPLDNVAAEPERSFDCDRQMMPLQMDGRVLAIVHSHPNGPEGPSAHDQNQQRAFGVPWGLLMCNNEVASTPFFWGDALEPPPLEGRPFRHGPSGTDGKGDCGALVRDWYRINRRVIIKDYARDDKWWNHGEHLYLNNYEDAGFVTADMNTPEVGDLILLSVGNKVPTANHAAIYIGGGLMIHHLERRLSRVDPFLGWRRCVRAWLRHAHS